jgi:hypothetical protein
MHTCLTHTPTTIWAHPLSLSLTHTQTGRPSAPGYLLSNKRLPETDTHSCLTTHANTRRLADLQRQETEMAGQLAGFRRRVAEQREAAGRDLAMAMHRVAASEASPPRSVRASFTGGA